MENNNEIIKQPNWAENLQTLIDFEEDRKKIFIARLKTSNNLEGVRKIFEKNGYKVFIVTEEDYKNKSAGVSQVEILGMAQGYGVGNQPNNLPKPPIAFLITEETYQKLADKDENFVSRWRQDIAYTANTTIS